LRDKERTKQVSEEQFNDLWEINLGIKEDRGRIRERSEGDIIPRPAIETIFKGNPLNKTIPENDAPSKME